ncbi:MAG: hypothetical protein ABEI78_01315, partial [Candidatus Nanohaloarchaea archaeon]
YYIESFFADPFFNVLFYASFFLVYKEYFSGFNWDKAKEYGFYVGLPAAAYLIIGLIVKGFGSFSDLFADLLFVLPSVWFIIYGSMQFLHQISNYEKQVFTFYVSTGLSLLIIIFGPVLELITSQGISYGSFDLPFFLLSSGLIIWLIYE